MKTYVYPEIISYKQLYLLGYNKLSATLKPTVRPLTDRHKPTDNAIFAKAVWLSLRKIKRAAIQPHKPTQIAAHLILPNRTTATRQHSAQPTVFFLIFAP